MIASWLLLAVTFGAPIEMTSLSEPVEIAIDGRGVPTVMAASMEDALRGEGFIHARDRYFQMDMMRRFASIACIASKCFNRFRCPAASAVLSVKSVPYGITFCLFILSLMVILIFIIRHLCCMSESDQ